MIILVGHSASGKSTIERYLEEEYGYERIISCTTRPPRAYEKHGVDYIFMDEGVFAFMKAMDMFAETTTYRGWHYGVLKDRCKEDSLAVLEPKGIQQMIDMFGREKLVIIFVNTDEDVREQRLIQRGDDRAEINRRIMSDRELFGNLSFVPDLVFYNNYETKFELEQALDFFVKMCLESELKERGWK